MYFFCFILNSHMHQRECYKCCSMLAKSSLIELSGCEREHVHKQTHSPNTNNYIWFMWFHLVHMLIQDKAKHAMPRSTHFQPMTNICRNTNHTYFLCHFILLCCSCFILYFCFFFRLLLCCFFVCDFSIEIYTKCSHKHVLLQFAVSSWASCALKPAIFRLIGPFPRYIPFFFSSSSLSHLSFVFGCWFLFSTGGPNQNAKKMT